MNIYDLFKGASHKYKYRKLTGHDKKTGRPKYRYYYDYRHGGGIQSAEHFKVGSKFEFSYGNQRGHFRIDSIKGDKITVTHDEIAGFSVNFSRKEFSALLGAQHRKQQIKKPKEEPQKEGSSALEKAILEKHLVTAENLRDSYKSWVLSVKTDRKYNRSDEIFKKRLRSLGGEFGFNPKTTTPSREAYNALLERSAKENREVLKAVEEYRLLAKRHGDEEKREDAQKDRLVEEKEKEVQELIISAIAEHATEEKLNWNLKHISSMAPFLPQFKNKTPAEARLIHEQSLIKDESYSKKDQKFFVATYGEKVSEVIFGQLADLFPSLTASSPNEYINEYLWALDTNQTAKDNYETRLAEKETALQKIASAVQKSCKGFDTSPNADAHKQHRHAGVGWEVEPAEVDLKDRAWERLAGHCARVEDVFREAYPDRKTEINFIFEENVRANYVPDQRDGGTVIMSYKDTRDAHRVATHEIAHTLEYDEGENIIKEVVTLTHLTRIEQGKTKDMKYSTGAEEAFDDEYSSLYTGKLYRDGKASELVSMGVQELLGDPKTQAKTQAHFALRDPHHFLISYGILKGYAKL
jgi:hypothetical protein